MAPADPTDDYGRSDRPDWRAVDWASHQRETVLDGARVRYVDLGLGDPASDGPPVLFVHGLGGSWQNWLENLPAVAAHRRVLAVDLPGFGHSTLPEGEVSVPRYAGFLDRLCAELELGPVVAVGNSLGGFIAAELAVSYPERGAGLVLVGAAGLSFTRARRHATVTMIAVTSVLSTRLAARHRAIAARPRLRQMGLRGVARQGGRLRPDVVLEQMQPRTDGFGPALAAALSYNVEDRVHAVACPTLVVWGRQDALVPASHADRYQALIPGARKTVMENTGHVPQLERPRAFNRLLLEFLGAGREEVRGPGVETADVAD